MPKELPEPGSSPAPLHEGLFCARVASTFGFEVYIGFGVVSMIGCRKHDDGYVFDGRCPSLDSSLLSLRAINLEHARCASRHNCVLTRAYFVRQRLLGMCLFVITGRSRL